MHGSSHWHPGGQFSGSVRNPLPLPYQMHHGLEFTFRRSGLLRMRSADANHQQVDRTERDLWKSEPSRIRNGSLLMNHSKSIASRAIQNRCYQCVEPPTIGNSQSRTNLFSEIALTRRDDSVQQRASRTLPSLSRATRCKADSSISTPSAFRICSNRTSGFSPERV